MRWRTGHHHRPGVACVAARFTSILRSLGGDTYLIGETIRAQVTWSQNVTVDAGGSNRNVYVILDLGADDNDLTNSQRRMAYVSGSGTNTLTFEYTVQPGAADMDADGVWLQTASGGDNTVVFVENGATLTGGNPATNNAVRTRANMPTTGDASPEGGREQHGHGGCRRRPGGADFGAAATLIRQRVVHQRETRPSPMPGPRHGGTTVQQIATIDLRVLAESQASRRTSHRIISPRTPSTLVVN